MPQNLTDRVRYFKRAWSLDLCGDMKSASARRDLQDRLCSALAFYAMLLSRPSTLGPTRASSLWLSPTNRNSADDLMSDVLQKNRRLDDAKGVISDRQHKAIEFYILNGQNKSQAAFAAKLTLGRKGDNAANMALAGALRDAAERLLAHFSRSGKGDEFYQGLVSSEKLGLELTYRD
jgi:hypothetical protein